MTHPYRSVGQHRPANWDPPAPVLPLIVVDNMAPGSPAECDGLLDTGADGTLFPGWVAMQLGLVPVSDVEVHEGPNTRTCNTYLVDIGFPWQDFVELELPGDDTRDHALIGRDILNQLKLVLDGPAQQVGP